MGVDRSALKTGSQSNRVRLIGDNLPAQITAADLDLGSGVTVRRVVSHTPGEVVAEVDVAADAVRASAISPSAAPCYKAQSRSTIALTILK